MKLRLSGKVVLVTGAARGIGAAVGAEAARRGARVALTGLEPDELATRVAELGEGHIQIEADVTDAESIAAAVERTVAELGGIDVVVANAGIAPYGTVQQGAPEAWLRTIEINLNGVYRTVQAALPQVIERRGHVCVISSTSAFSPLAGMSAYTASKAGVEAFTRALDQEIRFRGASAGSVHPGWIDTDLTRDADADLTAFREMRERLPWPMHKAISAAECARLIADGVERRSARVYTPRSVAVLYWLRSLLGSPIGEWLLRREAARYVPQMEREIAALGRAASARTAEINRLEGATPQAAGLDADR